MSLLLANGHPDAADYPIPKVWDEAAFVVDRKNGELINLAVAVQKATATTGMTASREQVEAFNKWLKAMNGE